MRFRHRDGPLPEELFTNPDYTSLSLSFTDIDTVDPRVLDMSQLEELKLTHTKVDRLPDLSRLSALRSLAWSNPPEASLEGLRGLPLRTLDLSVEGPTDLSVLHELPDLRALTLQLRRVQLDTMPPLPPWLTSLELETWSSSLSEVDLAALSALTHLKLDLRGPQTLELRGLRALQTLDLRMQDLTVLPELPARLTSLQVCRAKATALPNSLGACRDLETLRVVKVPIETVPEEVGELTLEELELSGTHVATLPDSVARLVHLRKLVLKGTADHPIALPVSMEGWGALEELHVEHSSAGALPLGAATWQRLRWLSVTHTPLRTLPDALAALPSLTNVNLSNTALRQLPRGVSEREILHALSLDGCSFRPRALRDLHALKAQRPGWIRVRMPEEGEPDPDEEPDQTPLSEAVLRELERLGLGPQAPGPSRFGDRPLRLAPALSSLLGLTWPDGCQFLWPGLPMAVRPVAHDVMADHPACEDRVWLAIAAGPHATWVVSAVDAEPSDPTVWRLAEADTPGADDGPLSRFLSRLDVP